MPGTDEILDRLVEEGARAARQPSVSHILRRTRRRRARQRSAYGVLVAVTVLAIPLGWQAGEGTEPAPTSSSSGTAGPTLPSVSTSRTTAPTLSPAERAKLVAAQQEGTLTITPDVVRAGDSVRVAGRGCAPGQQVSLDLAPGTGASVAAIFVADGSGSFEGAVTIPANSSTGVLRPSSRCPSASTGGSITQYGGLYVAGP